VQGDIVSQGFELMLYGMGTVVVFLTLLVASTTAMSRLVTRYFPQPEVSPVASLDRPAGQPAPADNAELIAVIGAAIQRYRNR
jgi:oxaloacetate decarboxylase gamma subunit